ncbi:MULTISPECIES: hypothetical protein [Halorussus]|uniref:hypothetical protein n=1 Tax=Halorussus TaxID=1070314 RepID=UPI000E21A6BE|nr:MULTISPECIES: hypothetical protein [Halorussus]NHN61688.1 hypothetical protein [Halorussus sp. JP-T4]
MRRLLVGLFVVALVVGQTGGAAATSPSAEAACGQTGGGEVLVGILPGASSPSDSQVLTDETGLYPGTRFEVALCKDGQLKHTRGSEWELASTPGLEVLKKGDATVTVNVTGAEPTVDLPGLVDGKQNLGGVSVVVPDGSTADSALADGQITFESSAAADAYNESEGRYLAALSNLTAATARLNESAATLEAGEADPDNLSVAGESVADPVVRHRNAVANRSDALEDTLYEAAWRSGGDASALAALEAAQRRERTDGREAERAMERYLSALERAEGDAQTTVWLNLGGAALLGLVVGLVPGWKLTAGRLEDIRFDRQVNSDVDYGLGVFVRVAGLAAVALAVGIGGAVALGGPSILGGLL